LIIVIRFTLPWLRAPWAAAASGMIGRVTLLLSRSDLERLLDVGASSRDLRLHATVDIRAVTKGDH